MGLRSRGQDVVEVHVAEVMIQMYSALVFAQGWIIWHARRIDSGEIKKAMLQGYFGCFTATSLALGWAHFENTGGMRGGVMGVSLLIGMVTLSIGYGWFCFFQPP